MNVIAMSVIRYLDGALNLVVATLMFRSGSAAAALRWNALLGALGPLIMFAVSMVGVAGLSGKVSPFKLGLALVGAGLMYLSTL